jgi:hypothetical protein
MPAPIDAHGNNRININRRASAPALKDRSGNRGSTNSPYDDETLYNNWYNLYAKGITAGQPQGDPYGVGGGGSGGGGGGGGGRGGGGGGGFVDYMADTRNQLTGQLNEQRDSARGALPGYLQQFTQGVNDIGSQNQALTSGYTDQIKALFAQLQAQAQGEVAGLQGDLQAQGAPIQALAAQAGQGALGANNIATAQDAYNMRLAQVMQSGQADRLASGQAVNQAANSQLDNSYLQALMQIQGMR